MTKPHINKLGKYTLPIVGGERERIFAEQLFELLHTHPYPTLPAIPISPSVLFLFRAYHHPTYDIFYLPSLLSSVSLAKVESL